MKEHAADDTATDAQRSEPYGRWTASRTFSFLVGGALALWMGTIAFYNPVLFELAELERIIVRTAAGFVGLAVVTAWIGLFAIGVFCLYHGLNALAYQLLSAARVEASRVGGDARGDLSYSEAPRRQPHWYGPTDASRVLRRVLRGEENRSRVAARGSGGLVRPP